jgi:hypothetical protein
MEVGQGPNWGCSSKEKKNGIISEMKKSDNELEFFKG